MRRRAIGRAKRRLTRWLEESDPERRRARDSYYPQQDSCQIRHLWYLYALYLGERDQGVFVEVGANDGVTVSNTWGLAERSWTGLMIEPISETTQLCRHNHRNHPNVSVLECAVGATDGAFVTMNVAGVLTTANESVLKEYGSLDWASVFITGEQVTVRTRTLDAILEAHQAEVDFDVLVVDVEGFEADVMAGFSLERWSPRMLIIELVDTHPDLQATASTDAGLGRDVLNAGYVICFKDSINTVFVREDVWAAANALGRTPSAPVDHH